MNASKILVVDDEAIISMQIEERLSGMGYSVTGLAASGEDAIQKARDLRPDLVLMDIVMPGKLNGIDAAKIITNELGIPVVFVTSYADDRIIEQAKSVRPYGYIVKPFNERELKAAIEVALFRKAYEVSPITAPATPGKTQSVAQPAQNEESVTYLDLPEIKTILLNDIFSDMVLFLYTDPATKEDIFKSVLEAGIRKGGRTVFAYFASTVPKHFLQEIRTKRLFTFRMKPRNVLSLLPVLEKCTGTPQTGDENNTIQVLLDFSDTENFADILAVRNLVLEKRGEGIRITGMIAVNISAINHNRIQSLAEGIPKVIISTGKETTLSFAQHTFPAEAVSVVPQSTINEVIKKSLEPVVLSLLDKPISGYDIVHEIHNRYNVLIPQARVYTLLYELQQNGYLEIKLSGKSKLYCPTETGRKYFDQKLNDFKQVFQHIMGTSDGQKLISIRENTLR